MLLEELALAVLQLGWETASAPLAAGLSVLRSGPVTGVNPTPMPATTAATGDANSVKIKFRQYAVPGQKAANVWATIVNPKAIPP
ncbi:MAG: hypothetical protein R2748_07320 [Bryobacterales bacterium]